jgi:hypothetical protein
MASNTGENDQALRRILDMTRLISLIFLVLHVYYYCYTAFEHWKLVSPFSDRILDNIFKTGLLSFFNKTKLISLAFLTISLIAASGKKEEKLSTKTSFIYIGVGILVYFFNQ